MQNIKTMDNAQQILKTQLQILSLMRQEHCYNYDKLIVFVDAGHGGIHPNTGRYTTGGKRFRHEQHIGKLHGNGWFYEGVENRIIAEAYIQALSIHQIPYVRLYHPYEDTPLRARADVANYYLSKGYGGFCISFHSNASEAHSTEGISIWTYPGQNKSDEIATNLFENLEKVFPKEWLLRQDGDGDPDYEANFQIFRQTTMPCIMGEFFHFDHPADVLRLMNKTNQQLYIYQCLLPTTQWYFQELIKKRKS